MTQMVDVVSNVSPIQARTAQLQATCVGIDWGSSSRRTYLFGADGRRLAYVEDAEGALAARGRVGASLDILLAGLGVDTEVPVLVSGSAASLHAGLDVVCLDTEIPLTALARHLVHLDGPCFLVPGYRQSLPHADVLHGHATSLLGLVAGGAASGWAILPGMHSKWVCLHEGRVARWSTFVTGELFESQRHLGLTCPMMEAHWSDDPDGFERGLALARSGVPLSQALFAVRAGVVSGATPPAMAAPMLSGLLIGTEFQAMDGTPPASRAAHLIAGATLAPLYMLAADVFGWRLDVADPHALFGAGVRHLHRSAAF